MRTTHQRFLQWLMATDDGLSSDQEEILGFSASQERSAKRRLGGRVKISETFPHVHIRNIFRNMDLGHGACKWRVERSHSFIQPQQTSWHYLGLYSAVPTILWIQIRLFSRIIKNIFSRVFACLAQKILLFFLRRHVPDLMPAHAVDIINIHPGGGTLRVCQNPAAHTPCSGHLVKITRNHCSC